MTSRGDPRGGGPALGEIRLFQDREFRLGGLYHRYRVNRLAVVTGARGSSARREQQLLNVFGFDRRNIAQSRQAILTDRDPETVGRSSLAAPRRRGFHGVKFVVGDDYAILRWAVRGSDRGRIPALLTSFRNP